MKYQTVVWGLLVLLCCGGISVAGEIDKKVKTDEDWTESDVKWQTQSYWQNPEITQKYTFTPNTGDKVAGKSSVEVHMRVGAEKPRKNIELRLVPGKPLDLSNAEAIKVSLKVSEGSGMKPFQVLLCSPGYRKIAYVKWPVNLDLSKPGEWQDAILDLNEVRVHDKAKKGDGEYDRKDVSSVCFCFQLPAGEVNARLLIDGFHIVKLPPSPVRREKQSDGSYTITTPNYSAVISKNGYMKSLKAGQTEFLKNCSAIGSDAASGCFNDNKPAADNLVALDKVTPVGRKNLKAIGEKVSIEYIFREKDFDMIFQQKLTQRGGLLYFSLSPEVVAALDGRTDRSLLTDKLETGNQINTRLVTNTGGVLMCKQHRVGYSRMQMGPLPGKVWSFRFISWGMGRNKLTMHPIGKPQAPDAMGFQIDCADPNFLLPGGKPVNFNITATNYAGTSVTGTFSFQVKDYLTRQVVGKRKTPFQMKSGQKITVPTDVELKKPGIYRGEIIVADPQGNQRSANWVFIYDFPNYKVPLTRQPDFHEFWKETLEELAKIPLKPELTLAPEQSTETVEAYKIKFETLGGRHVYGWYCKPRKPGKYPARFTLPPSGLYPVNATRAGLSPNFCGLWISIHGLPVDFTADDRAKDPAAAGYWTHGIASPKTSMWRTIYASLVRGMDFLSSREEVDPKRIMAWGGSQGGGLTMVLAGLDKRVAFAAPAHSGLCRLDWTVLYEPGFWPFRMTAKPAGQTDEQFLKTLSYFDAANFTPDIKCPIFAEVSLLDTVTASGTQIAALSHVKPGLLELICDRWTSHAPGPRGRKLRAKAINRWMQGQSPVNNPNKKP